MPKFSSLTSMVNTSLLRYEVDVYTVMKNERTIARRLGTSDSEAIGNGWYKFNPGLKSRIKGISYGAEGLFILLENGQVARFQGKRSSYTLRATLFLFLPRLYNKVFIRSKGISFCDLKKKQS